MNASRWDSNTVRNILQKQPLQKPMIKPRRKIVKSKMNADNLEIKSITKSPYNYYKAKVKHQICINDKEQKRRKAMTDLVAWTHFDNVPSPYSVAQAVVNSKLTTIQLLQQLSRVAIQQLMHLTRTHSTK